MKIILADEAEKWATRMRANGFTIVQAHGCFDVIHAGHVRYLEAAKRRGDKLIVTVTGDRHVNKGPGRPIYPDEYRAEMLAALECVDAVVVNDNATAIPLIAKIKPNFYVKGKEYTNGHGEIFSENSEVEKHGGKTVFEGAGHTAKDLDGEVFSSTRTIARNGGLGNSDYLADARAKGYAKKIPALIERASNLSVLFVGESIVDSYVYVSPLGKPPKEFIIACRRHSVENFSGGIMAAERHASSFVSATEMICDRIVVKQRFVDMDYNRKLFEVYQMEDKPPSGDDEKKLAEIIAERAPKFQATVVIDFGHGMMTPHLRQAVRKHSNFLAVNAQSNSGNHGFNPVTNYAADYICVDGPEARLAYGNQHADLNECAVRLLRNAPKVCITDGGRGSLAANPRITAHVPSFSQKVVDTMGAGDAFLAVTAPLALLTDDMEMLAFIGNVAGALKVGTLGHREPVAKAAVLSYVRSLLA